MAVAMTHSTKGRVLFATTFQKPLHAVRNGQPVRLIALGDIEGMSPSYLYVDEEGNTDWASQAEFRVIDLDALPVTSPPGIGSLSRR